jgi:nitrite reductase (NADH) small subunit
VAVLLPDGSQVALFRLDDGTLHAVGNIDPFSGAAVMSRGIVGDRGGRATVQSPIKKQAFAFDDGSCLDDAEMSVPVYRTRVTPGGFVQIAR